LKKISRIVLLCLTAVLIHINGAAAENQTIWYVENEWNFVDQSMDVNGGIPSDASGVLAEIMRRGTLRVAMTADAAPLVILDSSKEGNERYLGADVMLARRIAERMNVELRIYMLEETQILPALTEKQCDLAISGIAFTPARAVSYTMSKGYYMPDNPDQIGVIVPEESGIESLKDLSGRILAAQRNSIPEAIGAQHVENYLEFRRTSTAQDVYEYVLTGRADAGFVIVRTAETYLRNRPDCGLRLVNNLSFIPDQQFLGYRVAAGKGEAQLISFVNGVIDEISENNQYLKWLEEQNP